MSGDVNLEAVAETEVVELDPVTEIARLAGLDPGAYEAERKDIAKALDFRVTSYEQRFRANQRGCRALSVPVCVERRQGEVEGA